MKLNHRFAAYLKIVVLLGISAVAMAVVTPVYASDEARCNCSIGNSVLWPCSVTSPGFRVRCDCTKTCVACGLGDTVSGCWDEQTCTLIADPVCNPGTGGNESDPTPPTGGCTQVSPTAPTLTSPTPLTPTPGKLLSTNILRPTWSGGGFGNGCPTTEGRDVQIRYDAGGEWYGFGNASQIEGLDWNTVYRWRVRYTNGRSGSNSSNAFFRTGPLPTITNFSVTSINTCSATNGYVGNAANGAGNPIIIQFDVYDPENDFAAGKNRFKNARVGISPLTNPARTFSDLDPTLHAPVTKNSAGFRVKLGTYPDSGTFSFSSIDYSDGSTGTLRTTGNHTNAAANATLLNLNTTGSTGTSVTAINNTTLRVKMVVRLENNFANGQFHVYAAVVSKRQDYGGAAITTISQNPGGSTNLRYTNYTLGIAPNRIVDTVAPTATVGTPQVTGANTFNVNWAASDSNGLALVRSYCYITPSPTGTIRDVALATNIALGNTVLNYPSPDNCLVNSISRLGNRSYQDLSGAITPGINFKLYVRDNACNTAQAVNFTVDNRPWISTGNGNASAKGGYNDFTIRDTGVNLTTLSSLSGTALTMPPYLSTYITISGNTSLVANKPSRYSLIGTNYTDDKIIPQVTGGTTIWADTIRGIISLQPGYAQTTATSFAAGTLSTRYSVAANATIYRYHTGNLALASNVVCNIKAVIVVEGVLTIAAPFTNSPLNTNGCIFVAKGGIVVQVGTHASASGAQQYDRLDGLFIADGWFRTLPVGLSSDRPNPALPADGLYVRGGIITKGFDSRRDLGGTRNPSYPAELIEYDPFYWSTFGDVLSSKKFSLRQE